MKTSYRVSLLRLVMQLHAPKASFGKTVIITHLCLCRALRILRTADVIFCEDCRHTRKLLTHFEISSMLESLHRHNEVNRSDRVVSLLRRGHAVALVCDAGTPGISDPGSITVAATVAAGYDVVPIPGPSAVCLIDVQQR